MFVTMSGYHVFLLKRILSPSWHHFYYVYLLKEQKIFKILHIAAIMMRLYFNPTENCVVFNWLRFTYLPQKSEKQLWMTWSHITGNGVFDLSEDCISCFSSPRFLICWQKYANYRHVNTVIIRKPLSSRRAVFKWKKE